MTPGIYNLDIHQTMLKSLLYSVIRFIYEVTIRSRLPYRIGYYNGIAVRTVPLLDITHDDYNPDFEETYISAICDSIRPGDHIVLLGGGWGVSTIWAARATGSEGQVDVFEGSIENLELVDAAIQMNEHPENIEIHEAIVGNPIDVFGTKTENRIHPKDLPNCDVLTMDIEGSEISVLKELTIRPRAIVVESHGLKGSPTQKITELVENLGYNVTNTEIDSSERSIDIITAKLNC